MMLAQAADFFTEKFLAYPFTSYKLCFVDDLASDVTIAASMSICSTRLLFPADVVDPIDNVTRLLVYALASQWIGVYVIPATANDWWIIVGGAWFMTDLYLRDLCGKNDYKYRQKMMADKVVAMDVKRPSIKDLGPHLALDPGEMEFMALKAPLVLSTLHHRLVKQSGKNGVDRCFWRILLNAKATNLPNSAISTDEFYKICEKVGHQRLDQFFKQWVEGGGCPSFQCSARFNKKKMLVEMTIDQVQGTSLGNFQEEQMVLEPSNFMREVKEHTHGVYAANLQHHFTGPMTIRIHEADGTPYEHIVDITSRKTRVDIPYNTKYKRLKRSRRQKERAAAAQGIDITGEAQDDVLLYCLGDVLQSEEEVKEWRLFDWSKEEEDKMNQESYEWFRIDADFEWICKTSVNMPSYMYVSQLQQDKDIVAQLESIQWLASKPGHELLSSILVRTLMDGRYFHGIRTLAANALANSAKDEINWIGLFHLEKAFKELYCIPESTMTRPNDFSDRTSYNIQCAIPKAIARIRDNSGRAPLRVKHFIGDLLRFNDNGENAYSDAHYIATLMSCLAQTLTTAHGSNWADDFDEDDNADELEFQQHALSELGRLQRVDEWISSYQNVITTTALQCSLTLMQNNIVPRRPREFMQYTKLGNADNVRLKAWSCLIELGMIRNPPILTFLLYSMHSDPSPFLREGLLRIFGYGIGQIALGELKDSEAKQSHDILQIEHDDGPTERQTDHARKTSVEGAVAALSKEISDDPVFKKSLEEALRARSTSLKDVEEILEICGLLYEPEDSLPVALRYPRYWKAHHTGKGVVKFSQTEKIRTKPIPKVAWATKPGPKAPGPRPAVPKRTLTLTMGNKAAIAAHVLQTRAAETPAPLPKLGNTTPSAPPATPISRPTEVHPPVHRSASSQTVPSQPSSNISPPPPHRSSPATTQRATPASQASHRASPASHRASPAAVRKIKPPKSLIVKLKVPSLASSAYTAASSQIAHVTATAPSAAARSMKVHSTPSQVYIKRQSPSPAPAASLLSPAESGNGASRKRGSEGLNDFADHRPLKRQASAEVVAAAGRPSMKIVLKFGKKNALAPQQ
jgi:transcription initiation factor TFIID subunit 2